jgi:hypothetical protein
MRLKQQLLSFRFSLALGLLSLAASAVAAAQAVPATRSVQSPPSAAAWQTFGNSADGFKALFPSEPEVSKNSVPVGPSTFELHSYVAEAGDTALYIGVCDYGASGTTADPDALLASAKTGAIEHMSAHILSEKKISLDSAHGVEFEAENDKLHFTSRMYLSGGVLYQSMVATPLNQKFADTAKFLDSFQMVARTPGTGLAAPPVKPPDWKAYPFPADGFTASFPFEPALQKQSLSTDAGTLEFRTYSAEDSSVGLIVAVCDYGAGAAGKDPDTILSGAESGAVKNIKGRLVSDKKITLNSNHGIEFQAENDSAHIVARVYLVGTVLYQAIVASPVNSNYPDTTRFLDSLQLPAPAGK